MIVGVAIKLDDKFYHLRRPARHSDVIQRMMEDLELDPLDGMHGFVTDKGEFLNRQEAWGYASANGQLAPELRDIPGFEPRLNSVHLW